jgi:hypothetical protein
VLLFRGGKILSPGPLLSYERSATFEDFLQAVDTANASARQRLAKIFPNYLERVVVERQSREADSDY